MKRFAAAACVIALCLALVSSPAHAVGEVYFTAVNDKLRPLTADTMPAWVGGVLYVPASVFDNNVTGVNLGFYCSQSRNSPTVTLYNLRQMLVFDLNEGNSRNQHTGEIFSDRAITRNGRTYLPVAAVCRFFNLEYTYTYTEYGYLLRIKSDSVVLTDASFIDAASTLMSSRLKTYTQSLTPTEPETPDEPDPPTPPVVDPPEVNVQVCLAFRCESGEGLEEILDLLDQAGYKGLFLFTAEELARQDDLVRRMVCSGHCVGLLAEGDGADETRAMLERGNETLEHVARMAATAVLVPAEQMEQLQTEGWVCWRETVNALPKEGESAAEYGGRLVKTIGKQQRTVYLTLDDGRETADMFSALLRQLEREQYTILTPLETRL